MAYRATWLVVVLVVAEGCDRLPYRQPCDQDADPDCCPPDSHAVHNLIDPMNDLIICAPNEIHDAGADGPCDAADAD